MLNRRIVTCKRVVLKDGIKTPLVLYIQQSSEREGRGGGERETAEEEGPRQPVKTEHTHYLK